MRCLTRCTYPCQEVEASIVRSGMGSRVARRWRADALGALEALEVQVRLGQEKVLWTGLGKDRQAALTGK